MEFEVDARWNSKDANPTGIAYTAWKKLTSAPREND